MLVCMLQRAQAKFDYWCNNKIPYFLETTLSLAVNFVGTAQHVWSASSRQLFFCYFSLLGIVVDIF